MKLASKIKDGRINAINVLLDMTIEEYLAVARDIIKNNEFQRSRVKSSSTIYALLKKDLKNNCTIPPIVLAIKNDKIQNFLNPDLITEGDLIDLFKSENLIILDGLQRTLTIIDLVDELIKPSSESDIYKKVINNPLRIEIYIGVNKIGILYRMLTLNTGQTPMSIRHQIEILYSDYISDNSINNIQLFKETDSKKVTQIGQYQFKDVIEGFNSYLDRDELGINRSDLLENIQNLEKLALENSSNDLFKEYINTYNQILKKISDLSNNWSYTEKEQINSPFGKNILQIFTKPQVLSAFGAASGKLRDLNIITNFNDIEKIISEIKISEINSEALVFDNLLLKLDEIKNRAKKIGVEQRMFFTYFFRELLNNNSDSYLNIEKAIENGFNKYSSLI